MIVDTWTLIAIAMDLLAHNFTALYLQRLERHWKCTWILSKSFDFKTMDKIIRTQGV